MTESELLERVAHLTIWKKGDERAPHKPLLNGIALCSMHHKLFDRGVFTLTEKKVLLVSEEANGTNGFHEWLMKYHGESIRRPIHPDYEPSQNYLHWHVREVFKGPSRYYV